MKLFRVRLISVIAVVLVALTFAFQNCGDGFKSATNGTLNAPSIACRAQLKSDAVKQKFARVLLNCDDLGSYLCERRIFSPDSEDKYEISKECSADYRSCVEVEIRHFNTSVARGPDSDPNAFQRGGEYNREEIRCFNKFLYEGIAPFEGEADSIEESLQKAMVACHAAEGGS